MMSRNKFARLIILALAFALFLSSCGESPVTPGPETSEEITTPEITTAAEDPTIRLIAEDGSCRYSVIRPEKDESSEIKALTTVRSAIDKTLGASPDVKNDWLNPKTGEQPGEYEILIAGTNRPESAEAAKDVKGKYSYAVKIIGKKICIVGGSPASTLKAAETFAELIKTNNGVFEPDFVLLENVNPESLVPHIKGETAFDVETLHEGVIYTHYSLGADSAFGKQEIYTVEFDPTQTDLCLDVVQNGSYATSQVKTSSVADKITSADNGKTVIAAVNGDLWMTNAHSRNVGGTSEYKGYSDFVTTKTLTVPRGFNIYDGEIITSAHMEQETPYEGAFYSFGIMDDGTAILGNPQLVISITGGGNTVTADGLNRLPANNAIVLYSDRVKSNNCLDEAYELVVECGEYKITNGGKISGKIKKVIPEGTATSDIAKGEIRLTARGSKISSLKKFAVGDTIDISFTVKDSVAGTAKWKKVTNAVGGHIPVIINGKSQNSNNNTVYPMTVMGIKADGNVVMLVADGRGAGGATGLKISETDKLCEELGIVTAFLLDGGGSSGMILNKDGKGTVVNNPSDGSERSVVNSVVLSFKSK